MVASLALLIALGGTGYAAMRLSRNSVTTVQENDFGLLATSNVARSRAGDCGICRLSRTSRGPAGRADLPKVR